MHRKLTYADELTLTTKIRKMGPVHAQTFSLPDPLTTELDSCSCSKEALLLPHQSQRIRDTRLMPRMVGIRRFSQGRKTTGLSGRIRSCGELGLTLNTEPIII